ncbi:hypothetical protein LCGC14_0916530 [marine sediment metagenome]|uniref:Uncharacterized protein n=1 Tax=marine sediment metagenome TaxID=412755 RepID=A0A0F9RYW4_9ZZZZ
MTNPIPHCIIEPFYLGDLIWFQQGGRLWAVPRFGRSGYLDGRVGTAPRKVATRVAFKPVHTAMMVLRDNVWTAVRS